MGVDESAVYEILISLGKKTVNGVLIKISRIGKRVKREKKKK